MQDPLVPLSVLLRQLRDSRGLNQGELAALAGISAGMIGHVEAGTRALSRDSTELVADVLKLDATDRQRLLDARKRTSDLLSTKKPVDEDRVMERLDRIDVSLQKILSLLEESLGRDGHPAGTRPAARVVDISTAVKPARAAKKKTSPRPD